MGKYSTAVSGLSRCSITSMLVPLRSFPFSTYLLQVEMHLSLESHYKFMSKVTVVCRTGVLIRD